MHPKIKKTNLARVLVLCLGAAMVLVACSDTSLRGTSSGWSPVAAVAIPVDSNGRINEGKDLDALDSTFTVTNVTGFSVGQVLQIDDERLRITSIRDQDLTVSRGVDNTSPQPHADQTSIYALGTRFVLYVSTRQGDIKALIDDSSGTPLLHWNVRQEGTQ